MGFKARPKPDCRTCGACCVAPHEQDRFCDITDADVKRLPPQARRHVVYSSMFERLLRGLDSHEDGATALATKELVTRSGPLAGTTITVCVCLQGIVMKKVTCSIYADRPEVCRSAVTPGSRLCRAIRRDLEETIRTL